MCRRNAFDVGGNLLKSIIHIDLNSENHKASKLTELKLLRKSLINIKILSHSENDVFNSMSDGLQLNSPKSVVNSRNFSI